MTVCCGPSGSGKSSLALDTIYAEGQRRYVEIAVELRPPVPRPGAEAEGRARQRPVAGHQHRAEDDQQEPALDGRHRHRDLRLPAHPLRPARPAALPGLRHPDRHADGRRDHRQGPVAAGGDEALRDGPARAARGRRSTRRSGTRFAAPGSCGCASTASRYTVDEPPDDRPPPQARGRGGRRSRRRRSPARGRGSPRRSSRRSTWAAASCTSPTSMTTRTKPKWKVERYSQHLACDHCGRSFEPLNPHHFSFNSPLGWCPTCEGLGVQHGANAALLIRDAATVAPRRGGRRVAGARSEIGAGCRSPRRWRGTPASTSTRRSRSSTRRSSASSCTARAKRGCT